MRRETIPLTERMNLLRTGCCAHEEYAAASVYRFAHLSMADYFWGFPEQLAKLEFLTGIPHERMEAMTYQQLAKQIADTLYDTPSCGDGYLYAAIDLLAVPLMEEPQLPDYDETDDLPQSPAAPQVISLEQRLHTADILQECVMLSMVVESLFYILDKLSAAPSIIQQMYQQYFQNYGQRTYSELVRDSDRMPEEERRTIRLNLMIVPFAQVEKQPGRRYRGKKP